jgi:hypothetical protein
VYWYVSIDVLEELAGSMFRVVEEDNIEGMRQDLRNICTCVPMYTASRLTGLE